MSLTRTDAAPPLLIRDMWLEKIFPLLDKNDLYTLSLVSKEARQLVFHSFFRKKEFTERINHQIKHLTVSTERRFGSIAPGFETVLQATIGNTPALLAQKLLLVASTIAFGFLVKKSLTDAESSISPTFLLGCASLLAAQHFAFADNNKICIENDRQEAPRQQRMHRKLYGLSYLRDELPGLAIPDRHLVAPPYGIKRDASAVTPKIVDKSNKYYVETFFSKWKYALNDIYSSYQEACEYERKWGRRQ